MPIPDFVVVGHAARDLVPGGWQLGGTVSFAAAQAHRLGKSVGIVTRAAADMDLAAAFPFAEVAQHPSAKSTTFRNVYEAGHRTQTIESVADPIAADDVPESWRTAPVVLLGPLWGELAPGFASTFAAESLIGVSAQGWLRSADDAGRVMHTAWGGPPFWTGCDVLFVSDEDLEDGEREMERWTDELPFVAMTESLRGARIFADGRWRRIEAYPETEVDPTGAGDTFATALLIRLSETQDIEEAARFGAAAASVSVGGTGADAMPDRDAILARMRRHPEVTLR